MIEHNPKRAKFLSENLSKTVVLIGSASDKVLLEEENIENIDVFCAVTNDDESNIISSMLAKRLGARKVMTLINKAAYVDLVQGGVIDIAISPQQTTIGSLLTHVRRGDVVNVHSLRRGAAEAIEAIAEEIEIGCAEYDEDGECLVSFSSEDSMDMDDTESNSEAWENLSGELNGSASSLNGAALTGRRVILRTKQSEPGVVDEDCVASISDEECASDTSGHGASTEPNSSSKIVIRDPNFDKKEREKKERRKKEKKRKKLADKDRLNSREYTSEYTPARWQSWGTQVESNRIVAADFRRGARFYGNYHLDEEGGMTCMLLSPRGASVIQAARQLQRYFTIEQYRLLVLARLPGANSRYPTLAKLNSKYESVAQSIRRMNKSTTLKGNWFQRTTCGRTKRSRIFLKLSRIWSRPRRRSWHARRAKPRRRWRTTKLSKRGLRKRSGYR